METQNNESCCCGSSNLWKSIAIILIILAIAGAAYYFGTQNAKAPEKQVTTTPTATNTSSNSDSAVATPVSSNKYAGWSTLTDTKMGYTLRYPASWTAKIEDGITDQNSVQGSGISYHYLSLGPLDQSGQKWGMNIGIAKKGSNVRMSMRTGVAPIGYPLTKGEIIKIAGSDVQIYESIYNGKITELFSYSLEGGSTPLIINKDYFLDISLSYIGEYKRGSLGEPLPDAGNTTTRRSEPYLTVKKILESIEFTTSANAGGTSTSSAIYKNEKYGFQVSVPSVYKVLTDKTNLYGWPNAVALLIEPANGKQSYDIAIEVWDTEAKYKEKYKTSVSKMAVKKINDKFVTFTDASGGTSNDAAIDKIAATFKAN